MYGHRTATSYWLTSDVTTTQEPVTGDDVTRRIGRCAVCQAKAPLLTLHSQTSVVPGCPDGWTSQWSGYSFLMVSSDTLTGNTWTLDNNMALFDRNMV